MISATEKWHVQYLVMNVQVYSYRWWVGEFCPMGDQPVFCIDVCVYSKMDGFMHTHDINLSSLCLVRPM